MSLKIILNGREAALPEDLEVTLCFKNYYLDPEREDASYPLTLCLAQNRHIFGFVERENFPRVTQEYHAEVIFGPYRVIEGRAVVTGVSAHEVELFITTDKNTFWANAKKQYIDRLDLGGRAFDTPEALFAFLLSSIYQPLDFVACPVYETAGTRGRWYNYLVEGEEGLNFPLTHENVRYIPFLRLPALIRKIFEALGYTIAEAPLLDGEGFRDIIVICIRRSLEASNRVFSYRNYLPHISVYDFLMEVERKFGVVFWTEPGSRTVRIFSFDTGQATYSLPVLDGVEKHLIDESGQAGNAKGIIFKDAECADGYLAEYKPNLTYTYGDAENADTVECISTIVGVRTDTISEDIGQADPVYTCLQVAALQNPSTEDEKYSGQVSTELRFSVYRGICQPPDGLHPFLPYPLASPVGYPYTPSQYSLLWDNLFARYHNATCTTKASLREEHTFPIPGHIQNLRSITSLFTASLVIRHRSYLCSEQQLTLSLRSVRDYTVKCLC